MAKPTVYLSYSPGGRDHGIAVGTVLDALGYSHVDGSNLPQAAPNGCGILLRVRTHDPEHDMRIAADTTAFLRGRHTPTDGRIVDLIVVPGYAVWPENTRCPISYVNAVTQPYSDWMGELERALAGVHAQ